MIHNNIYNVIISNTYWATVKISKDELRKEGLKMVLYMHEAL